MHASLLLLLAAAPTEALRFLPHLNALQQTGRAAHAGPILSADLDLQNDPVTTPAPAVPKWLERLNSASRFASILCAIDCTVFPILLAVMPLINLSGAGTSAWLHKAAHAVALYFVAPIGGAAVTSNALQHRKLTIFAWGCSGLSLILLANIHLPHVLLGWHVPHALEQFLHARHEVINVMGCGLLLSSQWYAHKVLEKMGKCCGHADHGHGHSHSH